MRCGRVGPCASALYILLLAGCSQAPARPAVDGSVPEAAATPVDSPLPTVDAPPGWLELGTGVTEFTPLHEGDVVDVVFGCQGGQHIWMAVRAHGLEEQRVNLDVTFRRARDGEMVSSAFRVRTTLRADAAGTYAETLAQPVLVRSPAEVADEDIDIDARVELDSGVGLTAQLRVHARIGGSVCYSDAALDGAADAPDTLPDAAAGDM